MVRGRRTKKAKNPFPPTLKAFPFSRFIPNLLTLAALCAGLSSIRFALVDRWETAVTLVFVAMILDGMDGRVARLLNSASKLGAELDSLADSCNFGVVPGILVYLFSLKYLGVVGWPIVLFYTLCMVLRLARFNTLLDQPMGNYFIGVNAPFGALLSLTPLMLYFQFGYMLSPAFYGVWMFCVACALVSRIPTFSFKKGTIARPWILPLFIGAGVFVAMMISAPWLMLSLLSLIYVASIPFSMRLYKKQES